MKAATIVTCAVAVGATLVFSGCGKIAQKAAEKAAEVSLRHNGAKSAKVNLSEGKMTIKTDQGEMVVAGGDSASIPADFPKDVYVDKSARILMAMKNPQGFVLNMETDQAVNTVAETYASKMKAEGWTEDATTDMGDTRSLSYKKDKRQAVVIVSKGDNAVQVMLSVNEDKG